MNEEETCPQCGGNEWNGYDCIDCGFGLDLPVNQYETPEGNIVSCSEEDAYKNGYIFDCECGNRILWWEMQDHGTCITCWHNKNMSSRKDIDNNK